MILETPRLVLRPLLAADGAFLSELYADPEVARYVGGDRLDRAASHAQAERFAAEWAEHGWGQSVVEHAGEPIGRVGLHYWPDWDEIELGWVLARAWQGQGLATEAAQAWLDWSRDHAVAPTLTSVIDPANAASIRLAERLGFRFGRHDRTAWGDVDVYGLDLFAWHRRPAAY